MYVLKDPLWLPYPKRLQVGMKAEARTSSGGYCNNPGQRRGLGLGWQKWASEKWREYGYILMIKLIGLAKEKYMECGGKNKKEVSDDTTVFEQQEEKCCQ